MGRHPMRAAGEGNWAPSPFIPTDGSALWGAAYAAFGATKIDPTSTIANNLRLPGQYFDQESGLHYNWHRYYDPKTGRYLTHDLISVGQHAQMWMAGHASTRTTGKVLAMTSDKLSQRRVSFDVLSKLMWERPGLSLNPYAYVANSPLRWTDPTGLFNPGEGDGGGGSDGNDDGRFVDCKLALDLLMGAVKGPGGFLMGLMYCVYDCNTSCPGTEDKIITEFQVVHFPPFKCAPTTQRYFRK